MLCRGLSCLGKPSEHQPNHGKIDPSLFTAGKDFIVLGEPTPSREPSERTFHNPPPFEHMEAAGANLLPIDRGILGSPNTSQTTPGMFNNLDVPSECLLDPFDKAPLAVGAVSLDQFES